MTFGIANKAKGVIGGIVTLVILVVLVTNLLPTAMSAGDDLNATLGGGLLSNLFASSGFVWLLFMIGILLAVIAIVLPTGKKV